MRGDPLRTSKLHHAPFLAVHSRTQSRMLFVAVGLLKVSASHARHKKEARPDRSTPCLPGGDGTQLAASSVAAHQHAAQHSQEMLRPVV